MSDQPLDLPPGAPTAEAQNDETLTLQQVLGSPSWAEDQLHGSLTLRALRWLALLEQDDNTPPQPGKRVVSLDTQVEMFKVISDWLKTSKKTKGEGSEEGGAPGIEQMREVIRQELEKAEEKPKPRPYESGEEATEEELGDEDSFDALIAAANRKRRKNATRSPNIAAMKTDSNELDAMINRAREAAYREDD